MTETTNLKIRNARREDLDDIVRMLADDSLGSTRERYESPLPDFYYRAFDAIAADPGNELIVVEDDGKVIGTLQLTIIPHLAFGGGVRAQIEAVRVDSGYRGKGVGEHLFQWAIDQARDRGCHLVQLTTNKTRADAVRFYERLGFKATHEGMKLYLPTEPDA